MKKAIYVYAGRSDKNKKVLVEKKFLDIDDPKTEQLMLDFKGFLAFAKEAGYTVADISKEPFNDPTVIVNLAQAMQVAEKQLGYIAKNDNKRRR